MNTTYIRKNNTYIQYIHVHIYSSHYFEDQNSLMPTNSYRQGTCTIGLIGQMRYNRWIDGWIDVYIKGDNTDMWMDG